MATDQTESKLAYLFIFKAKSKTISETAKENIRIRWKLQEEDKEYLRKQMLIIILIKL